MNILNHVLSAEDGYLRSRLTREYLFGFMKQMKREYEAIRCKESGEESMRSRMALLFILRRIRHRLVFENKLMDIVDSETLFVAENMRISSASADGLRLVRSMESNRGSKPRTRANFPMDISQLLRSWLKENMDNPYPSDAEKAYLCQKTGLGPAQINNWFINARRRILPFMKGKYVNF